MRCPWPRNSSVKEAWSEARFVAWTHLRCVEKHGKTMVAKNWSLFHNRNRSASLGQALLSVYWYPLRPCAVNSVQLVRVLILLRSGHVLCLFFCFFGMQMSKNGSYFHLQNGLLESKVSLRPLHSRFVLFFWYVGGLGSRR